MVLFTVGLILSAITGYLPMVLEWVFTMALVRNTDFVVAGVVEL